MIPTINQEWFNEAEIELIKIRKGNVINANDMQKSIIKTQIHQLLAKAERLQVQAIKDKAPAKVFYLRNVIRHLQDEIEKGQ